MTFTLKIAPNCLSLDSKPVLEVDFASRKSRFETPKSVEANAEALLFLEISKTMQTPNRFTVQLAESLLIGAFSADPDKPVEALVAQAIKVALAFDVQAEALTNGGLPRSGNSEAKALPQPPKAKRSRR